LDHLLREIIMNTTETSSFNSDGANRIGPDTRADLHKAIDTAATKVQPMADRLASRAHTGLDRMSDTVNNVSGTLSERGKQLGESYQRVAETGRGYVRTSPVVSLLVAVAAGYGLSKLMGPRK
jgi:ElaB protein